MVYVSENKDSDDSSCVKRIKKKAKYEGCNFKTFQVAKPPEFSGIDGAVLEFDQAVARA